MECEERLKKIVDGFQKNRNAFSAIGDDTRQLILLVLLESDLSGIRVGEIAEETQWKEIADLVNLIYGSIRHISSRS